MCVCATYFGFTPMCVDSKQHFGLVAVVGIIIMNA